MHADNTHSLPRPLLVGGNLHALNPLFEKILRHEDWPELRSQVQAMVEHGAMALALDLGPSRKLAQKLPLLAQLLAEQAQLPLFLPMTRTDILKTIVRASKVPVVINAVTAEEKQLRHALALATNCGTGLVVLLTRPGITVFSTEQRLRIALDVLEAADRMGLPSERLYLDPVLTGRPDPLGRRLSRNMPELDPVLEFLALVREMDKGQCRTIAALDNATPGISGDRRRMAQQRILPLLLRAGLDAVLLNALDRRLMLGARECLRGPEAPPQAA